MKRRCVVVIGIILVMQLTGVLYYTYMPSLYPRYQDNSSTVDHVMMQQSRTNLNTTQHVQGMRANDLLNYNPAAKKYVIYLCGRKKFRSCGGWSDMLKGIMMTFYIAIATNRQLGIDVSRLPCDLNSYLLPNTIPWRVFHHDQMKNVSQIGYYNKFNALSFTKTCSEVNFTKWLDKDIAFFTANLDYVDCLQQNPFHREKLSWLQNQTRDKVFKIVYNALFKLSPRLENKLSNFKSRNNPLNQKLMCAQLRIGNKGDVMGGSPDTKDVQKVWNFFRNFSDASKYKIFVATDSNKVRAEAKTIFSTQIVESVGVVSHVALSGGSKVCSGLESVILDKRILMTCHVLVLSRSGVSRAAAYMRGTSDGLYCMVNHQLIKCSPSEIKPLFNVYGRR